MEFLYLLLCQQNCIQQNASHPFSRINRHVQDIWEVGNCKVVSSSYICVSNTIQEKQAVKKLPSKQYIATYSEKSKVMILPREHVEKSE